MGLEYFSKAWSIIIGNMGERNDMQRTDIMNPEVKLSKELESRQQIFINRLKTFCVEEAIKEFGDKEVSKCYVWTDADTPVGKQVVEMFMDERCLLFPYDSITYYKSGPEYFNPESKEYYVLQQFDFNHISDLNTLIEFVNFFALNNGFKLANN